MYRLLNACWPLAVFAGAIVPRQSSQKITINLNQEYQIIDGFGISEAFQRANSIVNLQEPKQTEVLDLLFNTTSGAGFSIVRNGIGSSPSNAKDWMITFAQDPGSPTAPPKYNWDGKDSGQLWFSQQAVGSHSQSPLVAHLADKHDRHRDTGSEYFMAMRGQPLAS
jgi:hypothetical protein